MYYSKFIPIKKKKLKNYYFAINKKDLTKYVLTNIRLTIQNYPAMTRSCIQLYYIRNRKWRLTFLLCIPEVKFSLEKILKF